MKIWILMGDAGFDYEPDIAVCGVFQKESAAIAAKLVEETAEPEDTYWIEEWEVE